jgi:hypothetical protein
MAAMRAAILLLIFMGSPAFAAAESLGVFSTWGAFRDSARCYAITEPVQQPRDAEQRPFAAIGYWPERGRGGQVHFRLAREKRQGSAVLLKVDGRSFQLLAGPRDAWAPDARADVEIQAAMRMGIEMSVETRSARGTLMRDQYRLRGAATAIDAAAIACAR